MALQWRKKFIVTICILFFIVVGCSNNESKVSFDLIDFSYTSDDPAIFSIKILSSGKIFLLKEIFNNKYYYTGKMRPEALDSLSCFIDFIKDIRIDPKYYDNCVDCSSYNIIIKQNDKIIESYLEGNKYLNELKPIIDYLLIIIDEINQNMNKFDFESKTNEFHEPPPPPLPPNL